MSERELFEESAARMGYNLTMAEHETGEYRYPVTQDAWNMWQECCDKAARQAPASGKVEPVGYMYRYEEHNEWFVEIGQLPFLVNEHKGWQVKPLYTHPPAKVPEGFILVPTPLVERWANVDAFNAPKGAAMELKITAQHMLTTPTPATTPETEWVKLSEDQPREVDVDVKLNDGSIIRNCLAQSDGDFYWKGGWSEMFILEHTVFAWRSATPPQEQ